MRAITTFRFAAMAAGAALVMSCSSTARFTTSKTSELNVLVYPTCDAPSVLFRELRDDRGRPIDSKSMPLRVRSGVYSIGLSCGIISGDLGTCIAPPQDDPTIDVPTYDLILKPRVRYEFSCLVVNGAWTYEMREHAF